MKSVSGRLSTKNPPYLYMKVQLTRDDDNQEDLSPSLYKFTMTQAIQESLGVAGAATQVDLLKTWTGGHALIRIPYLPPHTWQRLHLVTPDMKTQSRRGHFYAISMVDRNRPWFTVQGNHKLERLLEELGML